MWIFDKLNSVDGYDIYWLHEKDTKGIDEDELYVDEYRFYDDCEEIVKGGTEGFANYIVPDEMLDEWKEEAKEEDEDWIDLQKELY